MRNFFPARLHDPTKGHAFFTKTRVASTISVAGNDDTLIVIGKCNPTSKLNLVKRQFYGRAEPDLLLVLFLSPE